MAIDIVEVQTYSFFICHVTNVIKMSPDLEDEAMSPQVTSLTSLVVIVIAEVQIQGFAFEHVIKMSRDLVCGVFLP